MKKVSEQIQQCSPFLPNAGQIRELRITLGKDKAAEYLMKIAEATMARYHFEKLMTPGERLRAVMSRAGLSLDNLSKKAGISVTSICEYRAGRIIPRGHIQKSIAAALGVTPSEIWGDGFEEKGA
jgi:lambda repressor-like predicted transcriptional regulator